MYFNANRVFVGATDIRTCLGNQAVGQETAQIAHKTAYGHSKANRSGIWVELGRHFVGAVEHNCHGAGKEVL